MNISVSVIIPTRDRPEMLLKAIASLEKQTLLPQEIIVVDDSSKDIYWKNLVPQIGENIRSNLIWHQLEQTSGASVARNYGAKIATGNVLMFLDDDDTWNENKIANQVKILRDYPEIGLVYAGRRVVNEQGELQFSIIPKLKGKLYSELLLSNHIGVTSSVAIRKQIFVDAGGFDPKMPGRQDYDLWVRIAKLTNIEFDPNPTVNWTIHSKPGSQMNSRPELYRQAVKIFLAKYQQDLAQLPWLKQRQAYASQYSMLADKYGQIGSWKKYWYILRSLFQYPSLAAVARFLPYSLYLKLRKLN